MRLFVALTMVVAVAQATATLPARAAGTIRVTNYTSNFVKVNYRLNYPGIHGSLDLYKSACVAHTTQSAPPAVDNIRYDDKYILVNVWLEVMSGQCVGHVSFSKSFWGFAGSYHAFSIKLDRDPNPHLNKYQLFVITRDQ